MQINFKSRQVEAFRYFMINGSVTRAAEQLHISQPAVSRLLSDLEYRLGFTLFTRHHNKLEASPEAHLFYREVERHFIGMTHLAKIADTIAKNNVGQLRLGVMPICSYSFIGDVIAEFYQAHPDVQIRLESAQRSTLQEMVQAHQVDNAIITDCNQDSAEIHYQLLCKSRAVVVLPEGHPLSVKDSLTPQDLVQERFMTLAHGSPFRVRVEELFLREGVKRNIILESREQYTLFRLIQSGVGIAILDELMIKDHNQGVIARPLAPLIEWEYFLVQPKNKQQPTIVKTFNDHLFKYFNTIHSGS